MRVVTDTNVLVSALVGHGKPRRLLAELLARHQIVTSRPMLAELVAVVSREEFARIRKSQVRSFMSILVQRAFLVTATRTVRVIAEDPGDDIVLSTALEGNAPYIVSGDKHLLDLERFRGVRIVTVSDMLDILSVARRLH